MRNIFDKLKNLFIKYKMPILKLGIFIGYLVALIFLFVLIINLNIVALTNDNIYTIEQLEKIPNDFDCILILGAGIKQDGTPTPMLRDRLITGFEAYLSNKSIPVLVSGDSENIDYSETTTMKSFLIEKGVDKNIIISDGYGLSTYESIWRAKNVYGFNKILIVTQKYHLHRAIYIANKLDMLAYGLDSALVSYGKQPIYSLREYFARIKDMIYAELNLNPTYIEKWEEKYE